MNTIPNPWIASGYLFGAAGTKTISARLTRCLPGASINRLSKAGRAAVAEEVSSLLNETLGIDLVSVLAAAWRTHHELIAAGQRTAAKPNTEEVVELGSHRITSAHNPTIDVIIDGIRVATIHFELDVTFDITGAAATVRAGVLINIRPTRLDLTGVLYCEGVELARKHERLQLPGTLQLGDGYRLAAPRTPTRFGPVTRHTSPPSSRPIQT